MEGGVGSLALLDEGLEGLVSNFEDDVGIHFHNQRSISQEDGVLKLNSEDTLGENDALNGRDYITRLSAAHISKYSKNKANKVMA